uniref:Transmembrane protein n=1 Tax=Globisporangium ultimum (strain ATCC 200006 / CBS 805.95 / DAOM BR144) TaxID=431595 RepID=K3WME9_GLOUD
MAEPPPPDPAHLEEPQAATSPSFQPSTATSWLEKTQQVNAKLFMVKKLLFVVFLFGLDVRDLYYKIAWVGPMDSFSFKVGSTSILHTTPLVSAVTRDVRTQNAGEDVASGWSSFLSQCEDMYAFGDGGGPFFLSALANKCHFPATLSNGKVKVIPQLLLTSNLRVDALIWASCMLLHIGRRPSICQNHIATHFNDRYGFFTTQIKNSAVAPLESDAEAEILRLLDMLGTLYGCASPNLYRSEFVGFAAPQYRELLYGKEWLANDDISVLGQRFTIRQNTHSEYIIDYNEDLNQTSIQSKIAMNFSSTGPMYALMVVIDIALLLTHCYSFDEIVKWMLRPKYRALQQWIRDFETAENGVVHAPGSPPESKVSHGAVVLEEERFHSLFCASFYKHTNYLWLMRLTWVISWVIILPNSVVWTWSDSANEKFQAYLSSIKCWVLISGAIHFLWRTLVKIDERRAFQFVKGTYITNPEIVTIGAIAAAWLQDDVFLMCEKKWAIESQRVNDVTSFVGGYIAHGNTFQMANDYRTTTSLQILHILYGPLLRIILLSIGMVASWLIVKGDQISQGAKGRALI